MRKVLLCPYVGGGKGTDETLDNGLGVLFFCD